MSRRVRHKPRQKAGRVRQRLRGHFSMIRNFHLADVFTLGNGASGGATVLLAMSYMRDPQPWRVYAAAALTAAALVFDVLDGRIARWRHKASSLGRELDSLADVISFGVAPAAVGFAVGLDGFWDQLALLYFVCCGISRLARYNVTAEQMSADTGKVTYFEGTPIPTSIVPLAILMAVFYSDHLYAVTVLGVRLHLVALLFLASGSFMISKTLRIPKP
jgi:CDP-diacylglycerol---serine O-phosphatidyltransferase